MTIENTDVLLVNRGSTSNQIKYEKIKDDITLNLVNEANQDGKQYARQDGGWTEVVHPTPYSDMDVNDLLNTNTANAGEVLGWNGSNYEWKVGGGGGGETPGDISYTYPTGQQRTLQSRLEDYVSIKDFGAVGCDPNDPNDTTDDTLAIRAAMQAAGSRSIYVPSGTYRISESLIIDNACSIFGDGMASILLYEPSTDEQQNKACLRFEVNNTIWNEEDFFELHDIQVLCGPDRICQAGVQLLGLGDDPIIGPWNKLIIDNVTIGAFLHDTKLTSGYFKKGLVIGNCGGVVANNLMLTNQIFGEGNNARTDPDATGILIFSNKPRAMVRTLMLTNFYIQGWYQSIFATASAGTIESIYISQGECKGRAGFLFGAGVSATYLAGIHFDTWRGAIEQTGNSGVHRVIGCDIRSDDEQPWDGYLVQLNSQQTIFANNFVAVGGANGARGGAVAINATLPDTSDNTTVVNNIFEGPFSSNGIAILIQNGARNVTIGGNSFYQYEGNNTPWMNLAGSETYIYGQRGYN